MIPALLFAAAAGNFVPPSFTPEQDRQVLGTQAQGGPAAAAVIDARVDPKGKVSDCKAVATSGDAQLASSICGRVEGIQIEPASVSGASSYGVVRHVVGLPQAGAALSEPSDLELQVNRLPQGRATLRVKANVLVDAAGKPQACYAVGEAPQAYADVVCSQIAALTFGTIKDDGGKPVRYVRSVIIDFERARPVGQAPANGG